MYLFFIYFDLSIEKPLRYFQIYYKYFFIFLCRLVALPFPNCIHTPNPSCYLPLPLISLYRDGKQKANGLPVTVGKSTEHSLVSLIRDRSSHSASTAASAVAGGQQPFGRDRYPPVRNTLLTATDG